MIFFFLATGVATYVKEAATPIKCEEGLSGILAADNSDQNIGCYGDQGSFTDEILQKLDNEGRAVITQHRVMYVQFWQYPEISSSGAYSRSNSEGIH